MTDPHRRHQHFMVEDFLRRRAHGTCRDHEAGGMYNDLTDGNQDAVSGNAVQYPDVAIPRMLRHGSIHVVHGQSRHIGKRKRHGNPLLRNCPYDNAGTGGCVRLATQSDSKDRHYILGDAWNFSLDPSHLVKLPQCTRNSLSKSCVINPRDHQQHNNQNNNQPFHRGLNARVAA